MRVRASAFWSPISDDAESWLAERLLPAETLRPQDVPGDGMPAMLRRRMSVLSRMGIHVALRVDPDRSADFQVFASQHGEVGRSQKLIDGIVAGLDVSPTEFSLSVHNTTAGLYSLLGHSVTPAVCVAAGPSTFAAAWLEAESWSRVNPGGTVLVVNHEDVLPEEYAAFYPQPPKPFAFAMLLGGSDADRSEASPDVSLRYEAVSAGDALPMGPAFARWMQAGYHGALRITADGSSFVWSTST